MSIAGCSGVVPTTVVATTPAPGTLNAQLNVPETPTFNDPVAQTVMFAPSKISDFRVVESVNPVPETVTVEPTGPLVGATRIDPLKCSGRSPGAAPWAPPTGSVPWGEMAPAGDDPTATEGLETVTVDPEEPGPPGA